MPGPTIRILIADDHPMIRAGLNASINPEADLSVVAVASNPSFAVRKVRSGQVVQNQRRDLKGLHHRGGMGGSEPL